MPRDRYDDEDERDRYDEDLPARRSRRYDDDDDDDDDDRPLRRRARDDDDDDYDDDRPVRRRSSATPSYIRSTKDDRTMAMFCHLGGALLGWLVPLIIWLIKKDHSRFVDDQGKEALNFQLTMIIGFLIGGLTICITFGILLLAVAIVNWVFGIIAAVAANRGEVYRYPLCIRFIS